MYRKEEAFSSYKEELEKYAKNIDISKSRSHKMDYKESEHISAYGKLTRKDIDELISLAEESLEIVDENASEAFLGI